MDQAMNTPWGPARTTEIVAPGIVRYTTDSHGGLRLDAGRLREMREILECYPGAGRDGWFEEDLHVVLVVMAFPQFFSAKEVWASALTVERAAPLEKLKQFVDDGGCSAAEQVATSFRQEYGHAYLPVMMFGGRAGCEITFTRIGDGDRVTVKTSTGDAYYEGRLVSREEIERMGTVISDGRCTEA